MAVVRVVKTSMKRYVFDTLLQEITGGAYPEGGKLPPIAQLSGRFNTSSFTVFGALAELEKAGYITRRNGVGAFVRSVQPQITLADSVVLCMLSEGHIYGDLAQMLCAAVQENGYAPILIDAETPRGREQLLQLAYSGARTFLVHGTPRAVGLFADPAFGDKTLIGFSRWDAPRLPGQHLVLSDIGEGGRMMARHLHDRGHRRILVVAGGSHHVSGAEEARDGDSRPDRRSQGAVFLEAAEELGCAVDIAHARLQKDAPAAGRYAFEDDDLLSPVRSDDAPATAIFGTMDIIAYCAREQIRSREPGLLEGIEVAGFFDTPWSQAGPMPFTSVDLNLEKLVAEASTLVKRLAKNPKLAPVRKLVRPRLVVRTGSGGGGGRDAA